MYQDTVGADSNAVLLKLSDVADRQFFFSMCQGPASETSRSLTIVSLFSGKYPHTGRRSYAYQTLSSTAVAYTGLSIGSIRAGRA